ncbi:MAG: prepilin-type N-terminal cleavage/methylation domain-containing protein [Candidatus Faecousia sp.]|nr:prepilin-type N-terminal cleavage/methylation domain-containing protein [Candidatus Faecousia sp.]
MKKIKNTKGFTLMEMLIVVAIIAILIAIAIPTFTAQLEKAREAADIANIRSKYSEAMVEYLDGSGTTTPVTRTTPEMTQTKEEWQYVEWPEYLGETPATPTKGDTVTVTVDAEGKVSCDVTGASGTTTPSTTKP